MNMGEIPVEFTGVAVAIIIVLAALRSAGWPPDRFTPLTAVVLGVLVGIGFAVTGVLGWLPAIIGGVTVGGAAVGLHQVPKQMTD